MSRNREQRAEKARKKRAARDTRRSISAATPLASPTHRPPEPRPALENISQTTTSRMPRSRLAWSTLLAVATIVGALLGLLPFLVGLSVQSPSAAYDNQPFSVPFEITNDNPIPATQFTYTCIILDLKFKDGGEIRNGSAVPQQLSDRTLYWRESTTAHCEGLAKLDPTTEISSAEIMIRVNYRMLRISHSFEKAYVAVLDDHHRFRRWVPK